MTMNPETATMADMSGGKRDRHSDDTDSPGTSPNNRDSKLSCWDADGASGKENDEETAEKDKDTAEHPPATDTNAKIPSTLDQAEQSAAKEPIARTSTSNLHKIDHLYNDTTNNQENNKKNYKNNDTEDNNDNKVLKAETILQTTEANTSTEHHSVPSNIAPIVLDLTILKNLTAKWKGLDQHSKHLAPYMAIHRPQAEDEIDHALQHLKKDKGGILNRADWVKIFTLTASATGKNKNKFIKHLGARLAASDSKDLFLPHTAERLGGCLYLLWPRLDSRNRHLSRYLQRHCQTDQLVEASQ